MRQNAAQYDRHVAVGLSNLLNANANPIVTGGPIPGVGGDLISRNIQRGRDHGLPSYAAFYRHDLLMKGENPNGVMDCWSKRPPTIRQENWNLLKSLYRHPHHIDLFVGGIAEEPYQGAIFGRTFRAIIAQTFKNLKDGDRFFFTHRGNMNSAEYNQIMGRKLSDIVCETSSTIEAVKKNVFLVNSNVINCPKQTTLDIKAFTVFKATSTGKVVPLCDTNIGTCDRSFLLEIKCLSHLLWPNSKTFLIGTDGKFENLGCSHNFYKNFI